MQILAWSQGEDESGYRGCGVVFWRKLVAVTELLRKDGVKLPSEEPYIHSYNSFKSEEALHEALDDRLVLGERLLHARTNQLLGADYRSVPQLTKLLATKGDLLGDALSRFFDLGAYLSKPGARYLLRQRSCATNYLTRVRFGSQWSNTTQLVCTRCCSSD